MNRNAFTLLELLVVIGILAVVTIFAVPYLSTSIGQNEAKSTAWEMVDSLRQAQSKSMAGRGNNVWSVHFESDSFSLFKGSTYNPVDPENFDYDLPNILSLSSISLNGGGSDVTFNARKGDTDEYGSITILDTNSQETVVVTISVAGLIDFN